MNSRPVRQDDAAALVRIYNHYVRESIATFEERDVTVDEMRRRLADVQDAGLPWLVSERDGAVTGYAYAAPWKPRSAYRYTVEVTIYLDHLRTGQGSGIRLYGALIDELATRPVHAAIGGIALPNAASVALHERLGFEKVAHFRETGFKFDRRIDVGYWELILGPKAGGPG